MALKTFIQDYKKDHQATYKMLAEKTKLSRRTLEAYGNGEKKRITYTTAKKLSNGLNIDLEILEDYIR